MTVNEVASGPAHREVGTQHIVRTFKAQPADSDRIAYRLASTPEITHQEVITD